MSIKLSNKEWDEYINQYYNLDTSITINAFCKENNLSKQQFHYHKKRLKGVETLNTSVFHEVKLNNSSDSSTTVAEIASAVKIMIGNATIEIPVSETTLIASIITELVQQC